MYSFRMSFWMVPPTFLRSRPCFCAVAMKKASMIGIVPHQCGKMKRRGEACLPVLQKIFETLVGVARRTKARKLTHGPQTTAVHGGVDPACKRESSGKTQITILCESGEVFLALEAI